MPPIRVKNWNLPGGINTTVTGKDFSKYKGLWVYIYYAGRVLSRVYVDLSVTPQASNWAYTVCDASGTEEQTDIYICEFMINMEKTSLIFKKIGYITGSGSFTSRATDLAGYHIYKIEGVY